MVLRPPTTVTFEVTAVLRCPIFTPAYVEVPVGWVIFNFRGEPEGAP